MLSVIFLLLVSINTHAYFPENYGASQARFMQHASELASKYKNIVVGRFEVGAEKLPLDHIYIPAHVAAKKLIILTSGTHGPEAYAGSAISAMFVQETLPSMDLSETGILLVHALNPWGFKHHRRGTENNVNLNRNFDISLDLFATQNIGYDALRPHIEIREKVTHPYSFPAVRLLFEMLIKTDVTQASLTQAIGSGQYTSPTGLNYGGDKFEPQTEYMISLFKQIIPSYQEIFHIDLHTGLGDKGVLHIMTKNGMNKISRVKLAKLFNSQEENMYEITLPDAEGFYDIQGDYADILSKIDPSEDKVIIGITAEFGTVGRGLFGKLLTVNRLMLENRGHFSGYANDFSQKNIQDNFLELFYPNDDEWKKDVLMKGKFLSDEIIKRF